MKPFYQYIIIVLALLGLSVGQAQGGFVPGETPGSTPPFVPETPSGDGSVEGILGDVLGLLDDFSWEKIPGFACNVATAADGGGETEGTVCGIAAFYEEVTQLSESYENILHDKGEKLFLDFATKNLGLGSFVTAEELAGYSERIRIALEEGSDEDGPGPVRIVEEFVAIARDKAAAEDANYATAPEGSLENTYNDFIKKSPTVKAQYDAAQNDKTQIAATQGQSLTNVLQSGRIAEEQTESQFQEDHNEVVQEIAPKIFDEAQSSVSTRATVQEVVRAITIYMQQDAQQFAFISEQIATQTQQQVYLTNELHIMTQTLLEEKLQEVQKQQAAVKSALDANVKSFETAADRMVTMGTSVIAAGEPTPLDLALFDY